MLHRFKASYAAAQFYLKTGVFGHIKINIAVYRLSFLRSVQIHHMYPTGSRRFKASCGVHVVFGYFVDGGKVTL